MDYVKVKQNEKKGYAECLVGGVANLGFAESKTRRGRVVEKGNISPTLTTSEELYKIESKYVIRKLTPRECWRLMDFDDEDFNRASEVCSNTQLYKQAGNSIVVSVLEHVFRQML